MVQLSYPSPGQSAKWPLSYFRSVSFQAIRKAKNRQILAFEPRCEEVGRGGGGKGSLKFEVSRHNFEDSIATQKL